MSTPDISSVSFSRPSATTITAVVLVDGKQINRARPALLPAIQRAAKRSDRARG
ncbi:hypothetical protein I553_0161 [Mycobacterium xenopi 4042]|uniref:Uncharacterized protein n=1 Tax=Mycobacterium xenopi 4042 TaxID=1299334 RepID=X7YK80_MYCXE|nr:hypothetical protein I553_0161 [Mycobacterium xenopi 4042]